MQTVGKIALALAALGTAFVTGCAQAPDEAAAEVEAQESSIVGGSNYAGMPAVGALIEDGMQSCTGTLVTKRIVVTAAHCLEHNPAASRLRFAIGPNADAPETTLRVASFKIHPQWDSANLTNDIATMTLTQDAPVTPMDVASKMDSSWVGRPLFFVGYGVNDGRRQTGAGIKRAVSIPVSSVSATTFRYVDRAKNTCNGDSGGPAFYQDDNGNYLLAGVTSWGDANCTQFGVDTRVDVYRDFIGVSGVSTPTPPVQTACGKYTYEGTCEGSVVKWCENDKVQQDDCGDRSKSCKFDSAKKYYACR